MSGPEQATLAATFADEWARAGVTDAVIAPGSRSTPLVRALAAEDRVRLHVHLDERSAAFYALGMGMASGGPAVVVTTSGTAAASLHPAVIEAHHARVPLLVCTSDRPAELHDVGAPQTIAQNRLFESVLRWSFHVGGSGSVPVGSWRSIASRAVAETVGHPIGPGPVQLNVAFRDPLVAEPGELPAARPGGRPWHQAPAVAATDIDSGDVDHLRALATRRRGVIIAGAGCGDPSAVLELAHQLGWPVFADARSGCRSGDGAVVAAFDAVLRCERLAPIAPDVVVRLGRPPASRVLGEWLARCPEQIVVDPQWAWPDPDRTASLVVRSDPTAFCYLAAEELVPPVHGWEGVWEAAEAAAQEAIETVLSHHPEVTEPGVARALTAGLPAATPLFVSSSMPVRDVEWYGYPSSSVEVIANRGANGIDGIVSTAAGVAATAPDPVVALLGDVAFLHDSNGLIGAQERPGTLVLVVVDNDGGGIFSFLPEASALPPAQFERLFATPHGLNLSHVAAAFGVPVSSVERSVSVVDAVQQAAMAGGVHMVHLRTNRAANVAVHDELQRAVAAAVSDVAVPAQ